MLHSLVRVSRRVGCSHLSTNNQSARRGHSPARADLPSADTASSPHRGIQTDRGDPAQTGLRCTRENSRLSSVAPRPPDGRLYVPCTECRGTSLLTFWARSNCCWPAPNRSAEKSAAYPSQDAQSYPDPEHPPTSPEPDAEPLQLHSFPS